MSVPYRRITNDKDDKHWSAKSHRYALLALLILLILAVSALSVTALIFALRNGQSQQAPLISSLSVADCTNGIPISCVTATVGTVLLCNNTLIIYNCSDPLAGWTDVGNIRSALVAVNQSGADGDVLAWDTLSNGWIARGDPVYYGTNTQLLGGGTGTVTFGFNASTLGAASGVAIGSHAVAAGIGSLAAGHLATASGGRSVALGEQANSAGIDSVAIGKFASVTGAFSIAMQFRATCAGQQAMAIGYQANVASTSIEGIALGYISSAVENYDISIGAASAASGGSSIAIGAFSAADASSSVSIGFGATSNGIPNAVSLGSGAQAIDTAHALAFTVNSVSVTAVSLGISINGASRIIPLYTSLFASTGGAGPTVLTVNSARQQVFTTAQTVTLPVVSTLNVGYTFDIANTSGGSVVIQSSGGNTKITLATQTSARLTCILITGTTAASWMATGPVTVS